MDEVVFSPGLVVLAPGLAMLALNVAAATIVVGLAAVIVGKLCRRALLPLRHGMLCVATTLILASPVPVWMAFQWNLGLLPILVTSADSDEPEEFSFESPVIGVPMNGPTHSESQPASGNDVAFSESAEMAAALDVEAGSIDNPATNTVDLGFCFRDSPANRSGIAVTLSSAIRLFLLVWGAVGIWFAGRLIHGLVVVRRLRRSLRLSTDARLIEAARRVFAEAGAGAVPRIAESPIAPAPLTLGWWRPVIVLPGGLAGALSDDQLSCILAHELAHVRRRDTLIGLMQQLAAAAFWWNPFLHAVNHQINRLRERLCDDFATIQRGHSIALAEALVRVAEWSAARTVPSPMTNGLLEDFGDLEGRIRRLTEGDRTVSNLLAASRLSRGSVAALGGFGFLLGVLLLLPLLRADEGEWFDIPDLSANVRREPAVERIAGERSVQLSDPVPISVSGHVRTMDRKPVAGAKVYLLSIHGDNECLGSDEPLAVTHTDAEGRYQFQDIELPTIHTGQPNWPFARFGTFQVCGEMDGFGIAWHGCRDYYPTPRPEEFPNDDQDSRSHEGEAIEMDLLLRPARSLVGRILDERGQPVVNATIQLRDLDYLDSEGHEFSPSARGFRALYLTPERFHQTQTGADGRFEIRGLPNESVARVMIEHPDFAEQWLLAAITGTPITENRYIANASVTLTGGGDKPVRNPIWDTRSVRTSPVEIRVRAARRILVDVVHENDGTPAQGVTVSATPAGGDSEALSSGETDEQGRASLKLPSGEYKMYLLPIRTSDDLLTRREVLVEDRPDEQTFKLPLKKGCTLILEAVDVATGKGIPGVTFMKIPEDGGLFRHTGFSTNASGACRAIVEPGMQHYGIEIAEGYPDIDPFAHKNKKEVECEAGKTARLQFRLRK